MKLRFEMTRFVFLSFSLSSIFSFIIVVVLFYMLLFFISILWHLWRYLIHSTLGFVECWTHTHTHTQKHTQRKCCFGCFFGLWKLAPVVMWPVYSVRSSDIRNFARFLMLFSSCASLLLLFFFFCSPHLPGDHLYADLSKML